MKVGIIGGGITGLTIAYNLARSGVQVVLFEKKDSLGGLAAPLEIDGLFVEKSYCLIFNAL